jgi:hypothetical protein
LHPYIILPGIGLTAVAVELNQKLPVADIVHMFTGSANQRGKIRKNKCSYVEHEKSVPSSFPTCGSVLTVPVLSSNRTNISLLVLTL